MKPAGSTALLGPRLALVALALSFAGCRPPPPAELPPRHEAPLPATAKAVAERGGPIAPPVAICGNAQVEPGETCDDGNVSGGDGCTSGCRREPARFFSRGLVLLADGSLLIRETNQVLGGRVALSAHESALVETKDGPRYFPGGLPLISLPSAAAVTLLGAGCLSNERGEVWCLGGDFNSGIGPYAEPSPSVTEGGLTIIWNRLHLASGPIAGLAGDLASGCVLLDGGTQVQCWLPEVPFPSRSALSPKMQLGRGRAAKQIVAGERHFCALMQTGEVGCWGDSSFGQTGFIAPVPMPGDRRELGVPERRRTTPPASLLKFNSPAKWLVAGGDLSCALLDSGKVWCWGATDAFAFEDPEEPTFLGRMTTKPVNAGEVPRFKPLLASTMPHSPIQLPAGCSVKDLDLVLGNLCVACDRGCRKCWGGDSDEESSTRKTAPPDECLTF